MPLTIIDVAKEAGVSFKTVSRVLNGEPSVSPRTKEKVLLAAKKLNFRINTAARSLRSKRPYIVTLFLYNTSRSYAQDAQIGAMAGCQDLGLSLVIEEKLTPEILNRLSGDDATLGVILIPPHAHDPKLLAELRDAGVSYLRVGTEMEFEDSLTVGIDDLGAAREITNYLISLGHKKIAHICGPGKHLVSRPRREGFEAALIEADIRINPDYIQAGDFGYASGLEATERLLAMDNPPTAVFCANDEMAAGCLAAAYRNNVRVPEKLSVAGFDDSPVARVIYPSLTTVHQATRDMTKRAVELLHLSRQETEDAPHSVKLDHNLIVRKSTGRVPVS